MANWIGRLAPSPTGYLHLGNAWAFLLCWLAVKSRGGIVLLRIDDIDPQRSRQVYLDAILADLEWLGLGWDKEDVILQSRRAAVYETALTGLEGRGLVYPCFCTRRELRALASAPHPGEDDPLYPGTCAGLAGAEQRRRAGEPHSLRLKFPLAPVAFTDLVQGPQSFAYHDHGGDFPLKRSDGVWSYQLATAVDDSLSHVNLVARGRDLLASTARQLAILRYLGWPEPQYAHFPLLLDKSGERLAKRHNSLTLAALRKRGVSARQIVGFLARLAGLNPDAEWGSPAEFVENFQFDRIVGNDIILTDALLNKGLANDQ